MWRYLGAAFVIVTFHCLQAVFGDDCAQPRPFVGTQYKGCVWEACSAQSETGVCTFTSARFLSTLQQYQGLDLTASEDKFEKCVNAGRVLLSMVPGANSSKVGRDLRRLQTVETFSASEVPGIHWMSSGKEPFSRQSRLYSLARDLSQWFDSQLRHRRRGLLSVGERVVLQAPTVVKSPGDTPAVLPEVLDKVSQCPTELPDGVSPSNETLSLLQFVSQQCHDVDNVPASLVFGDVVDASQLAPTATVCLPLSVSLDAYVARVQCQISKSQEECLVPILEMWSIDSSLAQAVADASQAANNTCTRGYAEAAPANGSTDALLPKVSRQGCLFERSAAVDRFVANSWPRSNESANSEASGASAIPFRAWVPLALLAAVTAAFQWC